MVYSRGYVYTRGFRNLGVGHHSGALFKIQGPLDGLHHTVSNLTPSTLPALAIGDIPRCHSKLSTSSAMG